MAEDASAAEWHRRTAQERRGNVIEALGYQLDASIADSAAARLASLLGGCRRRMVISGDVDGYVSSLMLASVSDWRVVAVVLGSEHVLFHPDYDSLEAVTAEQGDLFGVDVFSTRFPSASNHPLLWGRRRLQSKSEAGLAAQAYDEMVRASALERLFVNPSLWVGIEASVGDPKQPLAATYRYPLGTAQILLATLEAAGHGPKMFDREFLPWLIANCDGGVKTIQDYPFNVPMWWSCMAAAVGPGSLSEAIYRLVSEQRVNQFMAVDRVFRYEAQETAAKVLDTDWNLPASATPQMIKVFVEWLRGISGWPDPFLGGVENLDGWKRVSPRRGVYWMTTLSKDGGVPEFQEHLKQSLLALHTSFSFFDQNWRLGWLSREVGDGARLVGGKRPRNAEAQIPNEEAVSPPEQ